MDSSTTDGKIISKGDLTKLAEDALNKIPEAMDSADDKKPQKSVKILFFEVDPAVIGYFQSVYNVFADFLTHVVVPRMFTIVSLGLSKTKLSPDMVRKTAALTAFGADATIKSGDYVRQVFSTRHDQYQQKADLARQLAPVLDEIKGSHSVAALLSVKPTENAMIYAQCKRLAKQHEVANFGKYVDVFVNAGPNLALSVPRFLSYWKYGKSTEEHQRDNPAPEGASQGMGTELKTIGGSAINATMPAIATKLKESGEKKLKRTQQPYSALEMILKLEHEISHNPKASAFSGPDGEAFSLEEYVARILIQHSKDMADLNPEHTEVRKALKGDLETLAKPIAEAISKGDLAPSTLIRWVGEGKLVKEHGRKLANVAEVEALLGHAEKRPQPPVTIDPKEYYTDAAFSQKELQTALGRLKGQERTQFASLFPDSVLHQAGMKDEEIKSIRSATLKSYENMLAQAIAGLAAQSDAVLEKDGLAKDEIKQLRDAHEALRSKGLAAVHEVRTNHANAHGIERALTNWAVPKVRGGLHLGTVLSKGRADLAAAPAPQPGAEKAMDTDKAADKAAATDTSADTKQATETTDSHVAAVQQQAATAMTADQAR